MSTSAGPDPFRRVRVLEVINSSVDGGGARHLEDLLSHLDRRRFLPTVATTDHGPLVRKLESRQIQVADIDMMRARWDPWPVIRLRRLLAQGQFDLVHLHGTRAGFFGTLALATLSVRPRVVYTVHGLSCSRDSSRPVKRFFAGVERYIATRADRVISVSEQDRSFGVEHSILPPGRTSSIPNGIEANGSIPPALPGCGVAPRVATVARLVRQKGIPVLLAASQSVLRRRPGVEFTIFGEGPDRSALEARAARLGVASQVHFAGNVANVAQRLGAFDLFVLPSLWEGMPFSLLEAMAAARPVVATSVSGSAELVIDGETGRLVEPGDPEALADAIRAVVADPAAARALAVRGRDRVRRNFSVSRMVDSTVELYLGLLSMNHDP